jgi:hypothetical protein
MIWFSSFRTGWPTTNVIQLEAAQISLLTSTDSTNDENGMFYSGENKKHHDLIEAVASLKNRKPHIS